MRGAEKAGQEQTFAAAFVRRAAGEGVKLSCSTFRFDFSPSLCV